MSDGAFIASLVGPLQASSARLRVHDYRGFRIPTVQRDSLTALCQQVLGDAVGGIPILAVGDWVWFDLATIDLEPLHEGDLPALPVVLETQVRILALRVDLAVGADGTDARSFCPFVFVEPAGPSVLAYLREVLGMNALLASFTENDQRVVVSASVLTDGAARVEQADIVSIAWGTDKGQRAELRLFDDRQRLLHLHQNRDPVTPSRAFVQEVVHAEVRLQDMALVQDFAGQVAIADFRSLRIAADLGIAAQTEFDARESWRCQQPFSSKLEIAPVALPKAPTPSNRPEFRFRRGDPQIAPGYAFRDVEIHGFRLDADRAALQKLCDRFLNEPFGERGYHYGAAASSLVVEVLRYGSLSTNRPALSGMEPEDFETQNELVFRVLVGRKADGAARATDPRVFCPLLVVDSCWSLITGREVVGYPKLFGRFVDEQSELGQPGQLGVFLADGTSLVTVTTPKAAIMPREDNIGWLWTEPGLADADNLDFDSFTTPWLADNARSYGIVQAKQCLRAGQRIHELVEAQYSVRNLRIAFQRTAADIEVHPALAAELGLAGDLLLVPPNSWYYARCDFALEIQDPLRL